MKSQQRALIKNERYKQMQFLSKKSKFTRPFIKHIYVLQERLAQQLSQSKDKDCSTTMMKIALSKLLLVLVLCVCLSIIQSERGKRLLSCQQRSTLGRSYVGKGNTTVEGIPCQRWSDTKPHQHNFTSVGDHNYCRNPDGATQTQVWCYTTALCC